MNGTMLRIPKNLKDELLILTIKEKKKSMAEMVRFLMAYYKTNQNNEVIRSVGMDQNS